MALGWLEETHSRSERHPNRTRWSWVSFSGVLLTVSIPGDDWLRLLRDSSSVLIDSSDSEDVLVVLDEFAADAGQCLALRLHDDPVEAAGLSALHDVVCYQVSSVLQRNLPGHRALFLSDTADHYLISWSSRGVCRYTIQTLLR